MSFAVAIMLLLVLMLALGIHLVLRSRKRGPDYANCGFCGYNVSASIGDVTRCPECGKDFVEVGIRPPNAGGSPVGLAIGMVLILCVLGCVGTSILGAISLSRSWRGPTTPAAPAPMPAQPPPQQPVDP